MTDEIKYLRMTIDVAVFSGGQRVAKELLNDGSDTSTVPTEDGKDVAVRRFHTFGTGERLARRFMDKIASGDIEIDEVRDVEDHTS